MKWENLNLHLENFFPGIVTLTFLLRIPQVHMSYFFNQTALQPLRESPFVVSIVFVSFAYILGVFVVALSRFLLDRPSEFTFRYWLLRGLLPNSPGDKTRAVIKEAYRKKMRRALRSNYDTIKNEVVKRRDRGRLIRTALVPSCLGAIALTESHPLLLRIALVLLIYVVILFLYAYTEKTIYQECQMIEQ